MLGHFKQFSALLIIINWCTFNYKASLLKKSQKRESSAYNILPNKLSTLCTSGIVYNILFFPTKHF